MFRRIAIGLAIALANIFTPIGAAYAETGVVALTVSSCDYYLIYTNLGFVLAEWYGGHVPSRGEAGVGSFNSYGFKTIFFGQNGGESRVWIEEYWLDQNEALEQLSDKCN